MSTVITISLFTESLAADSHQEREVTCPICFEKFEEDHAPRTLRCGHSVCTPCLETILARPAGDRNCPECRRPLKVRSSLSLSSLSAVANISHGKGPIKLLYVRFHVYPRPWFPLIYHTFGMCGTWFGWPTGSQAGACHSCTGVSRRVGGQPSVLS